MISPTNLVKSRSVFLFLHGISNLIRRNICRLHSHTIVGIVGGRLGSNAKSDVCSASANDPVVGSPVWLYVCVFTYYIYIYINYCTLSSTWSIELKNIYRVYAKDAHVLVERLISSILCYHSTEANSVQVL